MVLLSLALVVSAPAHGGSYDESRLQEALCRALLADEPDVRTVRDQLERGADPNAPCVLHVPVRKTQGHHVRATGLRGLYTLPRYVPGQVVPGTPNTTMEERVAPLALAADRARPEVALTLLDAGAYPPGGAVEPDEPGAIALARAVERAEPAMLDALLDRGVRIPGLDDLDPTWIVTLAGDPPLLARLCALGLAPDAYPARGAGGTALARVVLTDPVATEALLACGAHPDGARYSSPVPFDLAIAEGSDDLVQRLLAAGATIDPPGGEGPSALVRAARRGSVHDVERLLALGASAAVRDPLGMNPLDAAAAAGSLDLVRIFLDRGVEAQVDQLYHVSTLGFAVMGRSPEVFELLHATGAPITADLAEALWYAGNEDQDDPVAFAAWKVLAVHVLARHPPPSDELLAFVVDTEDAAFARDALAAASLRRAPLRRMARYARETDASDAMRRVITEARRAPRSPGRIGATLAPDGGDANGLLVVPAGGLLVRQAGG